MKPMYRAALMVAVFIFLLPLSARSEIWPGSFEVTPFVGYNFFETRQNLENRPIFGGRLGYNFTKRFGIEAAGEFIRTYVDDRGIMGPKEGQFGGPMDRVDLTFYHLNAVYHLIPDGKFNPFIVVGFGGANYRPTISTRDMAAFNVGVGAKYWLTDNIALRVDLQNYMVTELFQETYHNIRATMGITFSFGGRARPAPAPMARYESITVAPPEPKPVPAPEPVPVPPPPPPPKPRVEEKVIIFAAKPIIEEEDIVAAVSATKPAEKIVILAFEDIHFDFDRSTLNPEAQAILKRNVQMLKNNPNAKIRIAGYTSASGTHAYNQKLSERRATAVWEYLVKEDVITRDRLSTIGYGETRPAIYEAAPEELFSAAAKANMRVLFEIVVE